MYHLLTEGDTLMDALEPSVSVSPSVRIALNTQTAEDSRSDFENEYLEVTIQKQ